jgi:hypothetical protein
MAGLLAALALFLLGGGPAVYFFWTEMSELLYGRLDDVRFIVLVSAGLALCVIVGALAAYVRRLAGAEWQEDA